MAHVLRLCTGRSAANASGNSFMDTGSAQELIQQLLQFKSFGMIDYSLVIVSSVDRCYVLS